MSIFFKKIKTYNYINQKILIEHDRHYAKFLIKNNNIPFFIRRKYSFFYLKNGKKFFYGNMQFRCCFNYRAHSILSKISLSRFGLKQLGGRGYLAGFQKASW